MENAISLHAALVASEKCDIKVASASDSIDYSPYINVTPESCPGCEYYGLMLPIGIEPPKVGEEICLVVQGQDKKVIVQTVKTPEEIAAGKGGPVADSMIKGGIAFTVNCLPPGHEWLSRIASSKPSPKEPPVKHRMPQDRSLGTTVHKGREDKDPRRDRQQSNQNLRREYTGSSVIKLSPRNVTINTDERNPEQDAFSEIQRKVKHIDRNFYVMDFGEEGFVTLEMYAFDGQIHLAFITVPPEYRNKGLANRAMKIITDIADRHGVEMNLSVAPQGQGGLTKAQLFQWYKSHGFTRLPYTMQQDKLSDDMLRKPNKEASIIDRIAASIPVEKKIGVKNFTTFPHRTQSFAYDCCSTCVLMIMQYFGWKNNDKGNEQTIFDALGTTVDGTSNEECENGLTKLGIVWQNVHNLAEIDRNLLYGRPVIVSAATYPHDYHFLVIIAKENGEYIFADPWNVNLVRLSAGTWDKIWVEEDGSKWGVAIFGESKFENKIEPMDVKLAKIIDRIAIDLLRTSKVVFSSSAEKEVERLLMAIVPNSRWHSRVYSVGGFVRDEVLGIASKDLDIVVEKEGGSEEITKHLHGLFKDETSSPHRLGESYPIWQIDFKDDVTYRGKEYKTSGAEVQFADTQKESFPDEKSRQRISEPGTLDEDIKRRDLTVNSLLRDLTTGEIKDMTGTSLSDIKNGIIRGHPDVDFDEILRQDPLRMMRAVRFAVKYGWSLHNDVIEAVKRNAERIGIVSGERIRDELVKIMQVGKLAQAVKLMKDVGLLQYVLPEVEGLQGVEHDQRHHSEGDVYAHSMLVLQSAKPGVESQLAALLHDIGKPSTQEFVEDTIRFIGHEKVGGEIAEAIMRRLKFDGDVIRKVRVMVENHMRPHALTRDKNAGPTALRRFIRDVGEELVDAVLDLAEADALGNIPTRNMIPDLRDKIDKVLIKVVRAEKLPIDGNDIQRILGIKPGPEVGKILTHLRDVKYQWELDGKDMTADDAESIIKKEFG